MERNLTRGGKLGQSI